MRKLDSNVGGGRASATWSGNYTRRSKGPQSLEMVTNVLALSTGCSISLKQNENPPGGDLTCRMTP